MSYKIQILGRGPRGVTEGERKPARGEPARHAASASLTPLADPAPLGEALLPETNPGFGGFALTRFEPETKSSMSPEAAALGLLEKGPLRDPIENIVLTTAPAF